MPKRFLLLRQNARGRGDLMRHQRIWHGGEGTYYLQMICGIYAVLGIFLIAAARNPAENRSLISFTIWSSVVHAAIMAAPTFNTNDSGTFKRAVDMTDDELAAIVAKAKLTVVK